jgi:hypothetical protein
MTDRGSMSSDWLGVLNTVVNYMVSQYTEKCSDSGVIHLIWSDLAAEADR